MERFYYLVGIVRNIALNKRIAARSYGDVVNEIIDLIGEPDSTKLGNGLTPRRVQIKQALDMIDTMEKQL